MSDIEDEVIARFLARLRDSEAMPPDMLGQLENLLKAEKKPKSEDFVRLFSSADNEPLI